MYQSRHTLDLKKVTDFSKDLMKSMYDIAPLDTWGIFVWKREELLALKMLQLLGGINKDMEIGSDESRIQNPPKIFTVSDGD